jgi:tRNA pseudouridine38-40 synthase
MVENPDQRMEPAGKMSPNGAGTRNFRLTLAYYGGAFHGWQVQPGLKTVQGELQLAIGRVTGESPLPQGSGRTDAGVHATAQVASFELAAPIPPENLMQALNRTLPVEIRVMSAEIAPPGFHARHSAVAKTYEYRVYRGEVCEPWIAHHVYSYPKRLDFDGLAAAAAVFVGEHDFTSFAASDPDLAARDGSGEAPNNVRTVFASDWDRRTPSGPDLWVYRVRGNGFLHHMVRNFVGSMIDVGRGYTTVDRLREILKARKRSEAGPTAPACGLFLVSVEYDD